MPNIVIPRLRELLNEAWHSPNLDFSKVEELEKKIHSTYMELSRLLRSDTIKGFWYQTSNNNCIVWTNSLKSPDTIQKTYFIKMNGELIATNDQQINSYNKLCHECDADVTIHII